MKHHICSRLQNVEHQIDWVITVHNAELATEDINFIEKYNPVMYWSDSDCYYWAFDTQLPSGRWLENIKPEDGAFRKLFAVVE